MKKQRVAYITKIACLGAIATILMLFEFPLPFAPAFYELNFSEVAVLVAGFALGPLAAVWTELIKIILNLIINGTDTAFVGEISNFLMGVAFVLPAAFIYQKKKSLSGAVIGMVTGTLSLVIVSAVVNYFIMIPAYVRFMGFEMEMIIGLGNKVNSSITNLTSLILLATVPFNLVKGVACSLLSALIYKRISPILHKEF
ncbi:MAG: ECF transporter S component [Ruminococcaceae bacterium]|nr:ECF transporter S component [Oscillospiraceae bacterium]